MPDHKGTSSSRTSASGNLAIESDTQAAKKGGEVSAAYVLGWSLFLNSGLDGREPLWRVLLQEYRTFGYVGKVSSNRKKNNKEKH